MTIYGLYNQNGRRSGFWIQHRSWGNICAQVRSIAGASSGALPGHAPLYDNAKVIMQVFDVRSGRPLQSELSLHPPEDRNYAQIAEPYWVNRVKEPLSVSR